ncbi:MAG: hypothetical protein IT209_08670 [Armatimonadetes bacterium]|nr:hypothetical protein [Armatimonadota bacterium]
MPIFSGTVIAHASHWIYHTFATTPNTTYDISGYYAGGIAPTGTNTLAGTGWWEVGICDGGYDLAKNNNYANALSYVGNIAKPGDPNLPAQGLSFDWIHVTNQFTAPGTSATLFLKYGTFDNDASQKDRQFAAYFDNFSVTVVPEPTTFFQLSALVGMGGLFFPRLRRRA